MEIKYKNLIVDFIYEQNDLEMLMGYGRTVIPHKLFLAYVTYLDVDDDRVQLEYGEDEVNEWLSSGNEKEEDFETYNTDLSILFFNWCLDQDTECEFEHLGESPLWLLHDFMHAENDVYSGVINEGSYFETNAVYASMELAKRLGMICLFTVKYFEELDSEYLSRWKENFPVGEAINYLNELTQN
jgi:hypothetical protein